MLTQERLLGAQTTVCCSFADVERTILSFIFSLHCVSLYGEKEVIRIEGKISLFSGGSQDTSICECGQRIKHSVDSQNTMERESSYFFSSATEQIVSWHGYQVGRACTYEKWSFPDNFYRNRILLAVPKMLFCGKHVLALKRQIPLESMGGRSCISVQGQEPVSSELLGGSSCELCYPFPRIHVLGASLE